MGLETHELAATSKFGTRIVRAVLLASRRVGELLVQKSGRVWTGCFPPYRFASQIPSKGEVIE